MTIGYMKFVIMKTDIKEIVYLINNENFENSSFIIKYYNFIEKNIFYTDNEKFRWHIMKWNFYEIRISHFK